MKNEVNKKIIALIIADENELNNISWEKNSENIIGGYLFLKYSFLNNLIYVIHSKIGLINSSIVSTILINTFHVDTIFNFGVCGASEDFDINQIIVPYKIAFFDAITPWYVNGQMPQEEQYFINDFYNFNWANKFINQYKNEQTRLLSSIGFIFKNEQKDYWMKNFYNDQINDIFDMESASIAFTCKKFSVPFYSIKIVSDIIIKNNVSKEQINKQIEESAKSLFYLIIKIIEFYLSY